MGDEAPGGGFNPCECIWNHEMAMRRLLNALRNSQALCTDTECFEPGASSPGSAPTENFYFLIFVIGIAMMLFVLRPRPQAIEPMNKPNNNSNDPPPAPPIN
ncbi:unnamed protein product [Ceutorhynchus assimilis]|uniref:Small integral membrane protein 14 n=1 Tax=Ceutorhynchus assimilis TaxID=467358 RepID=A0A9N9MQ87_9CUCU|nr:unnamed protein product [Ceutorhynchus assimilis]